MKEDERKALTEGEQDILTPLIDADRPIYEGASCSQCGGTAIKSFDLIRALTTSRAIPRYNCKCTTCGCHFEPISGIIIEVGTTQALDPETLFPILTPERFGH